MNFFTLEKIQKQLTEIKLAVYRETRDIPTFKVHVGDTPDAHRVDYDDRAWDDFRIGGAWGGYDVIAWFRARVPVPAAWRERRVYLRLLVGPRDTGDSTAETLLYVNGRLLQGIDVWHADAWLPPEDLRDGEVSIALKAWSGVLEIPPQRRFCLAQLAWIDEAAEGLAYLTDTLLKAIAELAETDLRRIRLTQALDQAYRRLDWSQPRSDAFYRSVADAEAYLRAEIERLAEVVELKPRIVGVGHAHIDMAWLWRLAHTREKAAHTFATALHLMRQYPEYRFMHSSPQLYEYLKRDYPDLFAQVKERIAAGQWEITGGMWIEADTNLTSGESLIRQFLHGMRYMQREFGVTSTVLWLPDVFGYSWAVPQIARGSGITTFLTSKLSWSQFNRFPYDTFRWRGIDGTELLTHFVTTPERNSRIYTYNGQFTPSDVRGAWDNYRQKDVNDELLLLYGWGDGGGGPTREMLESARVLRNLPGLPSVGHGLAEDYFARLTERVAGQELPVWDGELYLEYHRGTYTSQAANKRANRQAEVLYHTAEWLAALADIRLGETRYPIERLDEGWELLLLNQFHDILPGSSIRQVYEDSQQDYARITAIGEDVAADAQARLLAQVGVDRESVVVFNPLSWPRTETLDLPWSPDWEGRSLEQADGRPAPVQVVGEGDGRRVLVEVDDVPPLGYRAYPRVPADPLGGGRVVPVRVVGYRGDERQPVAPTGDGQPAVQTRTDVRIVSREAGMVITPEQLENDFYRIALNERGQIVSLWDKRAQREVLPRGARANVFQTFVDKPMAFDAWDIDIYYQDKMVEVDSLEEAVVEETGPLRGTLRLRWRLGESVITQRLTLYRHSPRIDFRTEVDWRERQTLLKVAFPVDVRATRATYDIQFGQIERPTHWNTSWDWARFEVPAHKWADLSEGDYGVALLNDCKYGYDIHDNVMRLTLIKSAIRPDPLADQGRHVFTYALLPHRGDWRDGQVVRQGYELNVPLHARRIPAQPAAALPGQYALATVDASNVIIETVKREASGSAWILRVYETEQSLTHGVRLRFGQPLNRAQVCNLVEQEAQDIPIDGDSLCFDIRPYEIKTFRVWFA